jgi:hypothetical protein
MSIKVSSLSNMLRLIQKCQNLASQSQQFQPKISGWQPSYLRRRVLIVFVITFCGAIATLEALNHVSKVHDGIAFSVDRHHYLWTYVPTAIFAVIATFWSRVEFQVKQREPWKSMAEKPGDAVESILLDYVSDIQLTSIVKAIRNKHFDVAAGVACSVLLRLLVIFSTDLFSLQTAQMHRSSVPTQSSAIGQAIGNENRIAMTQPSLRVMEVCLILGISLAISMIFLEPSMAIAPWNPTSISSIAAIMAKSNEMCQSLRGTGATPSHALHYSLKERRYYSQITPKGFLIKAEGDNRGKLDDQESQAPAWEPFPSLIGRVVIFIAVGLLIATLEIALYVSQTNDGLGNVSSNEYHHYMWTIIPSLVMVSICLLFGMMDFNARSLAPYAQLQRPSGALFEESMTVNYLDSLAITAMIRSIRTKNFAVQATTLAAMITPFLVIVTSGLYSTIEVPHEMSINFTQAITFYSGNSADADSFSEAETPGMVVTKRILQRFEFSPLDLRRACIPHAFHGQLLILR